MIWRRRLEDTSLGMHIEEDVLNDFDDDDRLETP